MKVTAVQPLDHFRLQLLFSDGVSGVVNLSNLAGRGVLQIWEQPGMFERVTISPAGALQWPGEIDLCPDALYLQVTGKTPEELFPVLRRSLSHA